MKDLSSILAGCAVALAPVLLGLPGFTVLVVGLALLRSASSDDTTPSNIGKGGSTR